MRRAEGEDVTQLFNLIDTSRTFYTGIHSICPSCKLQYAEKVEVMATDKSSPLVSNTNSIISNNPHNVTDALSLLMMTKKSKPACVKFDL